MKKSGHIFILILLVGFISACTEKELTPEDEIKAFIKRGVEAAESRSTSDLMEMIDDNYQDQKKFSKLQLKQMLRAYFFRHKNIFLFTRIRDITFSSTQNAYVVLYVAMAGSVISDASMLTSLRARIYRFELDLIKQEEWLLQQASWQRASASDMN